MCIHTCVPAYNCMSSHALCRSVRASVCAPQYVCMGVYVCACVRVRVRERAYVQV